MDQERVLWNLNNFLKSQTHNQQMQLLPWVYSGKSHYKHYGNRSKKSWGVEFPERSSKSVNVQGSAQDWNKNSWKYLINLFENLTHNITSHFTWQEQYIFFLWKKMFFLIQNICIAIVHGCRAKPLLWVTPNCRPCRACRLCRPCRLSTFFLTLDSLSHFFRFYSYKNNSVVMFVICPFDI